MTKEENEKRLARLKAIVSNLPDKPGSYQYYDENGTIIYVGKAKTLRIVCRLTSIKRWTDTRLRCL